ncbi:4-alpha-glucanotransferase [Aquisphaera giovannonii]|uniref:4-alpha-glucanotransferase n=1 Tax=Aquisphaera giovannonii TaxID=406548 RepID=A0A5B9WB57_9BACT|nr:4-alpha-glucanotransferase [Aquisphaera giovannonii]QEH37908.1 4-alpha-glucanotransferase [Aquisphaera giovannonii]
MRFPRSSGVLLHPTSLPGRFGVGDLGPEAHRFVDFLGDAGQRWWQVLPLGPTGGTPSPYQSPSSFAGNPLLISPELMVEEGLLSARDLTGLPKPEGERADFRAAAEIKGSLLRKAYDGFPAEHSAFGEYCAANARWLDDYALFMALKDAHGGRAWTEWERPLVARKEPALRKWREKLAAEVRFHRFVQFVFASQMARLRAHCDERAVKIIGDVPIFVAHDSADVWSRPELFHLDGKGRPTVQAGVPPDLFATTGQLWGNPLYRWEAHEEEGFAWWIERLRGLLNWVDLIRIDHFRGFESYWEVPGKAKTAAKGRWAPSPGVAFFKALERQFVELPFIAEDLGVITPEVDALREQFGLPGMRILQFGFSTDPKEDKNLPHRFVPNCVVYTGTHDNDTCVGWLTSNNVQTTQTPEQIAAERAFALRYLRSKGTEFSWDMIRLAFESVADIAIAPMQDLLGLDGSARMNVPGKAEGNWGWRFESRQLTAALGRRLAELTATYDRWNGDVPAEHDPRRIRSASEPLRGRRVAASRNGTAAGSPRRMPARGARASRPPGD